MPEATLPSVQWNLRRYRALTDGHAVAVVTCDAVMDERQERCAVPSTHQSHRNLEQPYFLLLAQPDA